MKKLAAKLFMTLATISALSTLSLANGTTAYMPGSAMDRAGFYTLYVVFDRYIGHLLVLPWAKAAKKS